MHSGAREPATIESFLSTLVRSGLLTQAEIDEQILGFSAASTDAKLMAEQFVKQGKLSSFQAKKLLKGQYAGLLLGPYEVMSPIGKGGMGTVYLARDKRIQKLLALKILPPKKARKNERLLERFRREVEINKRVAHPHIAWTYEGGEIQGVFYIAMEFIPGKTMSRLVVENGPFEVPLLARLAVEVTLGLFHAHSQGIIHRDMKPSNIMVTPNGHAKILDLGLALMADEINETREVIGGQGYVVGSMDYIAPEQIKNAAGVDGRADIYGLGCTLFFALAGRPPFPGGDARDKMKRHRREAPPRLLDLKPDLPPGFCQIIHRMMTKDPLGRYQTMTEVREELLPWIAGQPDLPMDESGDRSFQEAIDNIQSADLPSEMVNAAILAKSDPLLQLDNQSPAMLDDIPILEDSKKSIMWICLSIIGFWLLALLLLALMLWLR